MRCTQSHSSCASLKAFPSLLHDYPRSTLSRHCKKFAIAKAHFPPLFYTNNYLHPLYKGPLFTKKWYSSFFFFLVLKYVLVDVLDSRQYFILWDDILFKWYTQTSLTSRKKRTDKNSCHKQSNEMIQPSGYICVIYM